MKKTKILKTEKRKRRHRKCRLKISNNKDNRPRLCVFRSNKHIYAQIIDDNSGKTLFSANDFELKKETISALKKEKKMTTKNVVSYCVGKLIAQKAKDLKNKKIVFDRAGYKYHGRIKALADGAREGGLEF